MTKNNNRENNRKIKRNRRFRFNIAQWVFLFLFAYMCYLVIVYLMRDKVRFYEVSAGSMAEDAKYTGLILKAEDVEKSTAAGSVNYFVREGRHVSVGQRVYAIDGTGSLTKFIKDNGLEGLNISNADIKKIKNDLSLFSSDYEDENFADVYSSKYLLNSSLLEYATPDSFEGLEDKLKAENIQYTQELAKETGLVSFIIDGMEGLNPEAVTKDSFDMSKYNGVYINAGQKVGAGTAVYKIINSEDWSLVFPLDGEKARTYEEKGNLTVKFPTKNLSLKAAYSSFNGADGEKYGKLDFDRYVINFVSDRYVEFEVETNKASGLKIPKKTVVERELLMIPERFVSKGGNTTDLGFNKEVYSDKGTSIQFVTVDICGLFDENYYISDEADSKLKAGDYIVDINTNERYKLETKNTLRGVYNINKGYAVFKAIEILASNDEYYTIAKGTKYGLNVYDHILLDPDKVKDKDFIYQ